MCNKKFLWVWVLLFVLNTGDIAATVVGLEIGFIDESNPIMAYLFEKDMSTALAAKYAGLVMLLAIIVFATRHLSALIWYFMCFATAGLTVIVALHAYWIVKALSFL